MMKSDKIGDLLDEFAISNPAFDDQAARAFYAQHKDTLEAVLKVADSTKQNYEKQIKIMSQLRETELIKQRFTDEKISAGTFYARTGAVRFWNNQLLNLLGNHPEPKKIMEQVLLLNEIRKSKPISFTKRKSKASQNRALIKDWDSVLFSRLQKSKSKFKTATALSYLTGLRPEELMGGVQIRYFNDNLQIEINGAKVKYSDGGEVTQGMPKRKIKLDLNCEFTQEFIKMLGVEMNGSCEVKIDNKASFKVKSKSCCKFTLSNPSQLTN